MNWLDRQLDQEEKLRDGRARLWDALDHSIRDVVATYNESYGKSHGQILIDPINPGVKDRVTLIRDEYKQFTAGSSGMTQSEITITISDDGAYVQAQGKTLQKLKVMSSAAQNSTFVDGTEEGCSIDSACERLIRDFLLKVSNHK